MIEPRKPTHPKPYTGHEADARITETKELEKPKTQTEEEHQLSIIEKEEKIFFDEDDEIIEVNWE